MSEWRTTCSATLPITIRTGPVRPWVVMARRSISAPVDVGQNLLGGKPIADSGFRLDTLSLQSFLDFFEIPFRLFRYIDLRLRGVRPRKHQANATRIRIIFEPCVRASSRT